MFGQFFVLFGLMAVGYVCSRKKFLNNEMTVGVGNIVLFFTIPALLFTSLANTKVERDMLINFATVAGLQFISMLMFGRIIRLYYRFRKFNENHLNMLEVTAVSVNNAFIGFPIAMMFFGEEAVVYMSASVLGLNLYLWSVGLYIIKGVQGESVGTMVKTIVKGAINPNISSILLGLFASVIGLMAYIPDFVQEFIRSLGSVSTPLSLIYIGALTGNSGLRYLMKDRESLEASLIKMIVMPLFAFAFIFFIPVEPMVKTVYFIAMSLPSAAIVPMIVGRYGTGVEVSSKMVMLTTAFSMATVPVCITISRIWM
ncbi:AEC family transporter [Anaerotignum sp. MB30-C6]|uniref:AEC family transporter n=1 Tax=Anaerotignum sp. MB30-C6 TaxID=3070814 RepID=UPI0027DDC5E5|nr:AEC family transporter [Anaerotignum sp. MB30-C6]WMI80710.1 AEC family transporter [Anaerotignum sp. MB30-C6]